MPMLRPFRYQRRRALFGLALSLSIAALPAPLPAAEEEPLSALRHSALGLVERMVAQGVISPQQAANLTSSGGVSANATPRAVGTPRQILLSQEEREQIKAALRAELLAELQAELPRQTETLRESLHSSVLGEVLEQAPKETRTVELNEWQQQELLEQLKAEMLVAMEGVRKLARTSATEAAERAYSETPKDESGRRVIRVPYVPDFVREELREQVRNELRQQVAEDVAAQAEAERWRFPDALPEWVTKVKLGGDIRVRAQGDLFDRDNTAQGYRDYLAINADGGFDGNDPTHFLNTREDRQRMRLRARLKLDAEVTTNNKVQLRLTTGNTRDPVSTNQTLGNSGNRYELVLDRAFLRRKFVDLDGYNWLTMWAGRMPNPWLSSNLVWDGDLGFEGIAATYRRNMSGGDDLFALYDTSKSLFVTAGAFPLDEFELSAKDRWLFGAQIGGEMERENQDLMSLGLAYYDYQNLRARRTSVDDEEELARQLPTFIQKGNSYYNVALPPAADPLATTPEQYGLASDYKLLNLTGRYDYAGLAPIHIVGTVDYVRNLGFDKDEVSERVGSEVGDRGEGYQLQVTAGWPLLSKRGDWQLHAAYRYLEGDAVLDAFTDSDFHLGGTDTKGFELGGDYAFDENMWISGRWISATEIDGPPLSVDVIQVDLNAVY